MTKRFALTSTLAVILGFVASAGTSMVAQTPASKPGAKAPAKTCTPPKTPWGDPDLQGVYTNKDESGIPFERPAQFEGKKLEDVDDSEFAELLRERSAATAARAPSAGGETGAGPIHWYENYSARNSRAWLVIEPADGRIPPATPEADRRAAARAASRVGRGPADSYEDRSLYDQCITRGLPGRMMPASNG